MENLPRGFVFAIGLALSLPLALARPLAAQPAYRIKNINGGAPTSAPSDFAAVGGTLYFAANDGGNGRELWKSDGTPTGTVMVKDVNPGAADSMPFAITVVGSTLYFAATDGVNGYELWKSDGTAAGTVMVEDINPGPSLWDPSGLTAVGTTLFFSADDGWFIRQSTSPDGGLRGVGLHAGAGGLRRGRTDRHRRLPPALRPVVRPPVDDRDNVHPRLRRARLRARELRRFA